MYSRIFKFLNDSNSTYPLQFGFRQKYSTTHALISLTENIRKNLSKKSYPTENNMFQLVVMNQVLPLFYMVYHKVQSLVHFCF